MQIRSCKIEDLSAVLAIETAAYSHPWSKQHFLQELQATYSHIDLSIIQGQVAGYICYWVIAGELQILNVVTALDYRRSGVARNLLGHVFSQARSLNIERAFLEVRSGNLGAIALYRDFGFCDDGIRRGYYSDGEDALLMSCRLQ